ncbi:MAG TPA: glycosyl hydrolase [Candidatus Paceibacterota bacterium]|nr:glycosyl hydrolase [Verrucomicrobiota bacterium]HRZ45343.1 glycosyl hydrolase [Candidatus Paceibacterota bacterium]HRZ94346.1 glycosyl hydrolase [Candidatus Paceibacterota bacterium]
MAIQIDNRLTATALQPALARMFELSADKIRRLERAWDPRRGTPVSTVRGRYTSRGWTEWTQGFQFGSALLQFDATGERDFLERGRTATIRRMASHVSHFGVHDHGFNNISTYGNLRRLMLEGRIPHNPAELDFYELALKVSGAVQAARWTALPDGGGYIYSFNGPHSLFIDTLRSLRSLALAHQLGHALLTEHDERVSLWLRAVQHANTTARYAVYYGEGRDAYDQRGRTAHESIFNLNDGHYRCPNSQQGYSPFSTWTRGLAWAICGFAEELEFLAGQKPAGKDAIELDRRTAATWLKAATAAADFYLGQTPTCGVPYWDTGAPGLHRLGDYLDRPADPFNAWEPVDSSAAVIAAQGLLRLGNYLISQRQPRPGRRYRQAALTIARTLLDEPYLSTRPQHQGLLLHSVYHRPNGWDHIPRGQKIPNGESSMWGDYHLRELAILLWREAEQKPYPVFFAASGKTGADY